MTRSERAASKARIALAQAEARAAAAAGRCPRCGSPIRHNSAILGWVQCAGYGDPRMRPVADRGIPHCH